MNDHPAGSIRFVAIGDSFTEGVGDERPDGTPRGWADLVAQGWADAVGAPIGYANLAIRGKLMQPIVDEQLEPALALKPTHLSFNGGGNDMLRPRADLDGILEAYRHVLRRCDEEGVQLVLLSGGNPSGQLPMRGMIKRRGDLLTERVVELLADRPEVIRALNWGDGVLAAPEFWSEDRLHLNPRGHHRVAARVLEALGLTVPDGWWSLPADAGAAESAPHGLAYYRAHVGPWIRRRLTGTSSGDGRTAKYGDWTAIAPSLP